MGATLILALMLWLAGAFVEYKVIKGIPRLEPLFNGLTGIVISIAISMTLGFFIAPAAGVAVALAATMGMATNEFTYKLFSRADRLNAKRKNTVAQVKKFREEKPVIFNDAVTGIKSGIATIVALVLAIVWLIGLPVRIVRWCQSGINTIKNTLRPSRTHVTA